MVKNSINRTNKRYSTTCTTLAAIIIIATGTIALSLAQTPQTASAQFPAIWTKVVRDDQAGHAIGWDPDGLTRSFIITDVELTLASNVLINTHQSNFVVCSVDWRPNDIQFEVNCIETTSGYTPTGEMPVLGGGPADGAILYYTVIQVPILSLDIPTSEVETLAQNITAERREGGEESPE